ncbi:WD repeat-containing protein 90 [Schistosoma japonicum]|nr:WD repeat-containing protein 90 [Schistosoma japonicum]
MNSSQNPYFSIVKHYPLSSWKKRGDLNKIHFVTDPTISTKVLLIDGLATAVNHITVPKSHKCSLNLSGQYLYLIVKPLKDKKFLIRLECRTNKMVAFRVTVTNAFRASKISDLSLCISLPSFIFAPNVDEPKWLVLRFDLCKIISSFSSYRYHSLSRLQLCCSLLFYAAFTSDNEYSPFVLRNKNMVQKYTGVLPLPKEFQPFQNPDKLCNTLRFIAIPENLADDIRANGVNDVRTHENNNSLSSMENRNLKKSPRSIVLETTEDVNTCEEKNDGNKYEIPSNDKQNDEISDILQIENPHTVGTNISNQIFENNASNITLDLAYVASCPSYCTSLVITQDGRVIIFPCAAYIIVMEVDSKHQYFLEGHTAEVSGISLDVNGQIIASCQSSTLNPTHLCYGVVHVWRMPNLFHSSMNRQNPLGTGRVQNTYSLKSVCISNQGEFLIAHGIDVRSRGMIVIWDLRDLHRSSALSLLARSTVDNTINCLCLLPNEYRHNHVYDSFIRFATVSGNNNIHDTIDCNIADKLQCMKKNNFSEIRLWRFKYTSLKQEFIQKSDIQMNNVVKNKYHLSSSLLPLTSIIVPVLRQSLNFISCCIKPHLQNCNQSCDKLNYSLLVGSSTGHILEIDLNFFCISNIYQLIENSQEKKSTEYSNTIELKLSAFREFKNNQWILNFSDNLNHSKLCLVPLSSLHWINPGFHYSFGWLAVCTRDGSLILFDFNNSLNSVILSVKYPSVISALDSCPSDDDSFNGSSQHQSYIAIATRSGGLACLKLNFEFDFHINNMYDNGKELINEFRLSNCSPKRILSWQACSPIIATDLVQLDKLGSQCVLASLSSDGTLRIRHISSRRISINQPDDDEMKRIDTDENYNKHEVVETPLIDLIISDETPICIAIQPKLDWSELRLTDSDISRIHIACGYSKTGLIRVFAPSNAQMIYELNSHKGYDITALLYSPCGSYLYASDSSGQLSVWRIVADKETLFKSQLIHSLNYQMSVFSITKPLFIKQNSQITLSKFKKSVLTLSSKGLYIAYMGPQSGMLTVAKGISIITLHQLELHLLIFKYFPNNSTKSLPCQDDDCMHSLNFLQFISQYNTIYNDKDVIDYDNDDDKFLFICTSNGYLFKFNVIDGKLISCAEFNVVSNSPTTTFINAMKITSNGETLLLAESSTPFIYMTSTNLYSLYENNYTNNRCITYQKFSGHIYPIDSFYLTLDEKYCICIDKGYWCQYMKTKTTSNIEIYHTTKEVKASSIFIWNFKRIQKSHEVKLKSNNDNILEDKLKTEKSLTPLHSLLSVDCEYKSSLLETPEAIQCNIDEKNDITSCKVINENCELAKEINVQYNYSPLSHRHWTVYTSKIVNTLENFEPNVLNNLKFISINDNSMIGLLGFGCFNHMIDNLIWNSETGIFIYTNESLLVIEELETGLQSTFRSVMLNSLDNNIQFTGEILNSLALAPNKSVLAIGSTSYWHSNEDGSKCSSISSLITVPIKFPLHNGHHQLKHLSSLTTTFPTLKCDQYKRLLLPNHNNNNSKLTKEVINSDIMMKSTSYSYGVLLTMAFTMDSRHLITIEDYHTSGVKLWSVSNWTLLSAVNINEYFNQVLCSPLFSNEFITIGGHLNQVNDENVKLSSREGSVLFWKFDTQHPTYIRNDTVNIHSLNDTDFLNAKNAFTFTRGTNWSVSDNNITYNTEFCSAAYIKMSTKYEYYTIMPKVSLLLAVTDNFGGISIWDVNNHVCIHIFSAESNEISIISPIGPDNFVTGDINGSLNYWSIVIEFSTNEQHLTNEYQSLCNSNNNHVNRNKIKNIHIKSIKSIRHLDAGAILSACFDVEGKIGVISTSNCNL